MLSEQCGFSLSVVRILQLLLLSFISFMPTNQQTTIVYRSPHRKLSGINLVTNDVIKSSSDNCFVNKVSVCIFKDDIELGSIVFVRSNQGVHTYLCNNPQFQRKHGQQQQSTWKYSDIVSFMHQVTLCISFKISSEGIKGS